MKKTTNMLGIFILASASMVYADEGTKENNCGKLSVSITNSTDNNCTLRAYVLNHGYFKYTSHVPAFIPSGSTTTPIILQQSLIGPDIEITYLCGTDKTITIKSQQNFCFLQAGNITGTILRNHSMAAEYSAYEGSFFWSQHGSIHWNLR